MNGLSDSPKFHTLEMYMQRHIELDGDSHGPRARKILELLCENDPDKQREAFLSAKRALEARRRLWDGILTDLTKQK